MSRSLLLRRAVLASASFCWIGCSSAARTPFDPPDSTSPPTSFADLAAAEGALADLAPPSLLASVWVQPSNADDGTQLLITAVRGAAGQPPPSLTIGGRAATLISDPTASAWLYGYTVDRALDSPGDQTLLFAAPDSGATYQASGLLQFTFSDDDILPGGAARHSRLTQLGGNARTGAVLDETALTPTSVGSGSFGRLFSRPVDGQIYAQPLYLPGLALPSGRSANVVLVATEHDSVYAFDADDPAASAPLWRTSLGISVPNSSVAGACRSLAPEVGITGTPVIDPQTGILYVVATSVEGGQLAYRLHALDPRTGAEQLGGPVRIEGSVSGTSGDAIPFDPVQEQNRAALLLAHGVLYLAFGGYCDTDPYHGWLFAYDPATLGRLAVFNDTPDGSEGGIWQAGRGLVADDTGDVYLMTGNGTYDANAGGSSFGDSMVRLSYAAGTLAIKDWFTPFNQANLEALDLDLGSSGPILIRGTSLLVGADKQGKAYVVDRNDMGHYGLDDDSQIVQSFQLANGPVFASTALWQGPNGPLLYVWSVNDVLKSYALVDGQFETTPRSQGTLMLANIFGAVLSVSARGSNAGSAIVWAAEGPNSGAATLHAFDALDLGHELWHSGPQDYVGRTKFCPPLVAAGKVYLATTNDELVVFGLR